MPMNLDFSQLLWTQCLDKPPCNPPNSRLGCSCFRRDEDNSSHYGNVCRLFDALFTLAFQRTCPLLGLPHTFLSLTPHPHYAGPDRSNHVSQSHMSSFFFDTALLSPLLGILEWECMHHRRSISSDRNAAPRLGEIKG